MVPAPRSTSPVALLDETSSRFDRGDVAFATGELIRRLDEVRASLGPAAFRQFALGTCVAHPLARRLAADPLTRRSVEKPRGYAGDAVMLDYLYEGLSEAEREAVSSEGAAIFDVTAHRSAPAAAVRERRDLLARRLDEVAARTDGARVLSVACGHLREAKVSTAAREGGIAELFALDQDGASLEVVRRELAGLGVVPVHASVKDLLTGGARFSELDFVYSAGLYDYLDQAIATRLTAALFDALRPGGTLLVGNFVPEFAQIGYMQAFMDWWLVCRSPEQLAATAAAIDPARVASQRTSLGANGYVAYLELTRG